MPYWSIYCLLCDGYIADALLECVPRSRQAHPKFRALVLGRPGAALACPYCGGVIGFNEHGHPVIPESGWPIFRYGRSELEIKKVADGEALDATIAGWALRQRFIRPGSHLPFEGYTYAEDVPADEVVP